jgi:hypothetical protein
MTKLSAALLILALPALVTADINRSSLKPDRERPDALPWSVRRPQFGLTTIAPVPPAWNGACPSSATGSDRIQAACPAVTPQHVSRCLAQPDCRNDGNAPVLWPYAPRAHEERTSEKEQLLLKGRYQGSQLAN